MMRDMRLSWPVLSRHGVDALLFAEFAPLSFAVVAHAVCYALQSIAFLSPRTQVHRQQYAPPRLPLPSGC